MTYPPAGTTTADSALDLVPRVRVCVVRSPRRLQQLVLEPQAPNLGEPAVVQVLPELLARPGRSDDPRLLELGRPCRAEESMDLFEGTNWKPIQGIDDSTAIAWAVWLNSTLGRIAMLRNRGKKLAFPVYRPSGMTTTRCPDPGETEAIEALNAAYQLTKNEGTPQYRDGRCAVRDTWDEAVAQALGVDVETIFEYAELLASEPAVSQMSWRKMITEPNGEEHS